VSVSGAAALLFGGLTARDGCEAESPGESGARVGGEALALNDVLLLRRERGQWHAEQTSAPSEASCASASTPCGRHSHAAHWYTRRVGGRAECDAAGCMLVYGGRSQEGRALGDLWAWRLETADARGGWRQLHVHGGVAPSARSAPATALASDTLYVFGGSAGSERAEDVWALDLQRLRWQRLLLSGAAAARHGAAMVLLPLDAPAPSCLAPMRAAGSTASVRCWGSLCGSEALVLFGGNVPDVAGRLWALEGGGSCAAHCADGYGCDRAGGVCACALPSGCAEATASSLFDKATMIMISQAWAIMGVSAVAAMLGSTFQGAVLSLRRNG